MLVKVKSYKVPAYGRLLNYLMHDQERLHDDTGRRLLVIQNCKGTGVIEWIRDLQENESLRKFPRKGHSFMTQEILSFRKESGPHITIEKLREITREYMHRRNPRAQYIGTAHFDQKHYHIHIVVSGLEYGTGKSMRMSKQEFTELKQGIQSYVLKRYPELRQSAVRHGRKSETRTHDNEYQYKRRTGKPTKRDEIRDIVTRSRKSATSQPKFLATLQKQGIETYTRGGKPYGVRYQGRKYRFATMGVDIERSITVGVERDLQKREAQLRKARSDQRQHGRGRGAIN